MCVERAETYLDMKQAVLETILVFLTRFACLALLMTALFALTDVRLVSNRRPLEVCGDACEQDTENSILRERRIPYLEMRPFG